MHDTVLLGMLAFFLSLIATPLATMLATKLNLLDQPDNLRKFHQIPVPRVGGAAIVVACLATFWLLAASRYLGLGNGFDAVPLFALATKLAPAVTIVALLGLLDDVVELPAKTKLAGQLLAALTAFGSGININYFSGSFAADTFNWVVTVGWLVACSNAMNFIDGIDGASAGIGSIASLTVTGFAVIHGDTALATFSAIIAAALLGFLCFNFHPATVFLGDCGSLTVGFLLGCFGLLWSQKATTPLGFVAPVFLLIVPLADLTIAIIRRTLAGKSVFGADANHVHHRLIAKGLPVRNAVAALYAACISASVVALLQSTSGAATAIAATAILTVALLRAIALLGFFEATRETVAATPIPRKTPASQSAKFPVAVGE